MCSLQGGFLGRVSPETRKDAIGSGGGGGLCGCGSCRSYSPSASSPVLLLFFLPVLSSFGGCGGILHRQLASETTKFNSASAFSRKLFSLNSQEFLNANYRVMKLENRPPHRRKSTHRGSNTRRRRRNVLSFQTEPSAVLLLPSSTTAFFPTSSGVAAPSPSASQSPASSASASDAPLPSPVHAGASRGLRSRRGQRDRGGGDRTADIPSSLAAAGKTLLSVTLHKDFPWDIHLHFPTAA